MNKIQILLGACLAFSFEVSAQPSAPQRAVAVTKKTEPALSDADRSQPSDPKLVQLVDEALAAIKKESPIVHEDSLRVWKNFKSTSKPVNYTYRFWGRRIILWLKEEKMMAFDSEEKVGEVFKILWRKCLISKNAVVVLMVDSWSHLIYLEGSPSWEHRMENQESEPGTSAIDSKERKQEERVA